MLALGKMPNLWPVWLDGGAWVVLGTLSGEAAPGFETAEIWRGEHGRFAATLMPGVGVPPAQMGWVGKNLIVYGESEPGMNCVATVKNVRLAAVIDTMEGFEPIAGAVENSVPGDQGGGPGGPSIASQIAGMTSHRMILGELSLSGDCSVPLVAKANGRAAWARSEGSAFIPLVSPESLLADGPSPAAETVAKATAAFRKLPLWNKVQADWLKTEDAKTDPLWDTGVGISVVTAHAAERDWIYLSASGNCVFQGAAWALWEVTPAGKWKLRSNASTPSEPPSIYAVADLDGDGLIELISTGGIVKGTKGVWTTILDTRVDWIGCAC